MLTTPGSKSSSALGREIRSVARHSLVYVAGQAISRAVGFFMIPVYTSYIVPSNYGAMELIEILSSACLMIISMGVADGMSRFYYAEKSTAARRQIVSTIVLGFGALGLPVVFFLLLVAPVVARLVLGGIGDEARYVLCLRVVVVSGWFGMLCEVGLTYLRLRYLARLFVAVTTTQLVLALSLNIYLVCFLKWGILGIFCSTLITQCFTGLILAAILLRRVGVHLSLPILHRLMLFGLPLVPPQIGLMLGFSSNRFFLRWLGSPDPAVALAQVGIFSLGDKFGLIVNRFINVPFNAFWGPRRLELLLRNDPHARDTVACMCTYAVTCSTFFALLLAAGVSSLIGVIAGEAYRECHTVVPFVALAYIAVALESHFRTGMLYQRKTHWDTWVGLLTLAVVLLWNYLFVPRYGLLAAATSNLAGFAVRVSLIYLISQQLYPIPYELGRIARMLVAACVLYTLSQLIAFPSPWLTLFARTGLVLLFPLVLFVARFYRQGELEFVLDWVRSRAKASYRWAYPGAPELASAVKYSGREP
jgi:O-antigen/teichoic acid export membrane protein